MLIIGLTGSIGMGKSTAAALLRRDGAWVYDADAAVHRLLAPGGAAVKAVSLAFPDVPTAPGGVDRAALGARVFADAAALRRLEAILHPLVRRGQRAFIAKARRARRRFVVLDIPLLYETGGDRLCDWVIVASAPAAIQRQRVLRRPGMTTARFAAILAKQTPDAEKRRRADAVVASGLGRRRALHDLRRAVRLALSSAAPSRERILRA